MGIKINFANLKNHNYDLFLVVIDLIMVGLVIISLLLMSMDWLWEFSLVQTFFKGLSPAFYHFYNDNINYYFIAIDGVLVSVFITELLFRWALSVYRKTYRKWYYYPFVHWYDVLGCIPSGPFRLLRILRVIYIVNRLQRMEVLDLSESEIYARLKFYMQVITEEISDKVVIRVLNGIQEQMQAGAPVLARISSEVIIPRKDLLADWGADRLQRIILKIYLENQGHIRSYLDERVRQAVEQNQEVKRISRIPVLGDRITEDLERAVSDIVFRVIDGVAKDLSSQDNKELINAMVEEVVEAILTAQGDQDLNALAMAIASDALQIIKEQVAIQEWKLEVGEEGDMHIFKPPGPIPMDEKSDPAE